ncbi:Dabb family protein [Cognatishimia sp. F0-27]|uniref:Dabb family protein n=1 Tax=Cognatishimia sp. F0-27 TaxID=2816855 RepID=UPI001D0C5C11|nr:Dabb family protein [Cognatishimia sp. F0-27]
MLRHIVLVSFKSEASADQIAAWRDAVTGLCESDAEVLSFSLGMNIGQGPNHHDAALVADFEDMDAFRRYVGSDAHKAYVDNHARHVTDRLAAIQHEM